MAKYISYGKPLAGVSKIAPSLTASVADSVGSLISTGSVVFNNINITGGTIDGVVLGSSNPGPTNATTVTSGSPGQGYLSCFYGNTIGDSACWLPSQGQWSIQGDLLVRDISDLGHLRVSVNTLSSTNTNGNINLSTNGIGIVTINSGVSQSTGSGNIIFQTSNGHYSLSTSTTNSLFSGTDTLLSTGNGDITLSPGITPINYTIVLVSTGSSTITITTSTGNGLAPGDQITITGTNSTPVINGTFIVNSVVSTNSFTIQLDIPVSGLGTTGHVRKNNNIYLSSSDHIYIPTSTPLIFGDTLSSSPPSLISDGTTTTLISPEIVLEGNLTITGVTTAINSEIVTIEDPVFNLGGTNAYTVSDGMDRGISFRYYASGDKIGFFGRKNSTGCFTYIPDATENGNVYTGAVGCAAFGVLTATSITTSSDTVSTIGTLNTCNVFCSGAMTITGSTSVTLASPNVIASGNLNVTGVLSACTLNCAGNLSITGSTSVTLTSPNVITSGNLNVTGVLSACTLNCAGNLSISGNTSVTLTSPNVNMSGNLNVTGVLSTCTLNCSGNLSITGSTSVTLTSPNVITSGNLNVTGTLNACTLNCAGNLSITGGNSVTLTSPSVNVTGTLNVCTLNCSGAMSITGANSITLTTPTVIASGNLNVTGTLNACTLNCNGNLSISGANSITLTTPTVITSGNLNVTGTLNVCTLNCSGAMSISGNTSVTLNAPNTNVSTNLNVLNGTATIKNATVTTNLSIDSGAVISMGGNVVTNVATPISAADSANKQYVDDRVNLVILVTLSGTSYSEITSMTSGSIYINVKNIVSGGPSATFSISKNGASNSASPARFTSNAGTDTYERLSIKWGPNSGLMLRKSGANYNGVYKVSLQITQ